MRYHDYHLSGYSVSDHGGTITLHLVYDYPGLPKDHSEIEFTAVAAYRFVHTGGAIITEIYEVPLPELIEAIYDELTESWRCHGGFRSWDDDRLKYLLALENDGCRGWRIESAVGFEGFIISKDARQKALTGDITNLPAR